ncbi:hypothetical protein [Sphingorhabdus lacus]|uniref:hypothetical protein n=1 Tax=Sphingorhabdus lacus TaxID=392610 RepID=UPI003593ABA0
MRSKVIVIGLSLLGASAPVMAQDIEFRPGTGVSAQEMSPADDGAVNEIAAKMADPQMQDRIATAVETMTRTVMDMPVGPLIDSIEKARPGTVKRNIPHDATLADIADRDADALPEKLGEGSRQMLSMAGSLAQVMAAMMPEFERMGRAMEESFKAAKTQARNARN